MKKGIFIILVFYLVLSFSFILYAFDFVQNKSESKQTPNFILQNLEGEEVSLSDFQGRPVILFFWTTWCPHCLRALSTFNEEYQDMMTSGIELLAIDIGESKARIKSFIKKYSISYPILLDSDMSVASKYGVGGVPTVILISKQGKIVSVSNDLPYYYKSILLK